MSKLNLKVKKIKASKCRNKTFFLPHLNFSKKEGLYCTTNLIVGKISCSV